MSKKEKKTSTIYRERVYLRFLSFTLALIFLWSSYKPYDAFTWLLEVLPVIVGYLILYSTYSLFSFTRLAYLFLWLHGIILLIGGHYTYAEVPLFDWLQEQLHWSRNHYDRVGHLAQGFFPALITREVLLRLSPLRPGKWLFFLVVCVGLAISAFYELIEWWVALATGIAADAFLGTQGDVWDTQWDMCLALIGALSCLLLFQRRHDHSLRVEKPILTK